MTRRVEGDTPQAAADRLVARAEWLDARAGRLRHGSNAYSKTVARAAHLRACAKLIVSETEHGQTVRERLQEAGAFRLGWKGLAEWVTLISAEIFKVEKKRELASK